MPLPPLYEASASRMSRVRKLLSEEFFIRHCYPWLMHPWVRYLWRNIVRLFAVSGIFGALYYLFAEWVVALFSEASLGAVYMAHTPIELLIPLNSLIDGQNSGLSPLAQSMQVAYRLQGWLFAPCYAVGLWCLARKRVGLFGVVCAVLLSVGMAIIADTQGGTYTSGGLHNLGFEITFLCGCLAMFFAALVMPGRLFWGFRGYSLWAALLGMAAISTPMYFVSEWTPLLERVSIYLLLIWEIALGFAVLRVVR